MKKIAIIIQARIRSTRLPNKVLTDIEGKPMLWHHINRLKYSKYSPEIIIATTKSEEDKKILNFAKELNVKTYAGSVDDVLDRYYQAALKFNIDIIIRITADCPLIDPEVLDKVLEEFLKGDYDYVANARKNHQSYPDGLDVEVFSFSALEKAWKEAKWASQREHVGNYITDTDLFKLGDVENDQDLSNMRWTVDEKEDLQFVREIYSHLFHKKEIFLMKDILEVLNENPDLMKINNQYERNEGYLKSLREDKIVK